MALEPIIWTVVFFGADLLVLVVLANMTFQAEKRATAEGQNSETGTQAEA